MATKNTSTKTPKTSKTAPVLVAETPAPVLVSVAETPAPKAPKASAEDKAKAKATKDAERKTAQEKAKTEREAKAKATKDAKLAEAKAHPVCADHAHRVVSVVTTSPSTGRAVRVVVSCSFPGCADTREVATQDLFQSFFCATHNTKANRAALRAQTAGVVFAVRTPEPVAEPVAA